MWESISESAKYEKWKHNDRESNREADFFFQKNLETQDRRSREDPRTCPQKKSEKTFNHFDGLQWPNGAQTTFKSSSALSKNTPSTVV